MQQVNSTGFRLGSTGWQTNVNVSVNNEMSTELQSTVRKARAKRGSFLINSYYYYHRNVLFCPMLYYRYNQRSRLKKWLVGYLNKRQGMMAPPKVRYFVLNKNNIDSFKAVSKRQKNRKLLFPKADLKSKNKKDKRSQSMRGWLDLELNVYGVMSRRFAENLQWQLRESTFNLVPRAEFRAYNIFDFISGVNPIKGLQNYVLKRFSKMMYNSDVFVAMFLATQMNMSNLFAHSVQIGLERHAGKREQRRFLMMIRVMSERMVLWKSIDNRLLWRLSIFGKLDAKMRRVHFRLRVGFVRYQEADFLTNYTNATARTKFGTSSVRVWMRNLLN